MKFFDLRAGPKFGATQGLSFINRHLVQLSKKCHRTWPTCFSELYLSIRFKRCFAVFCSFWPQKSRIRPMGTPEWPKNHPKHLPDLPVTWLGSFPGVPHFVKYVVKQLAKNTFLTFFAADKPKKKSNVQTPLTPMVNCVYVRCSVNFTFFETF